MSEILIRKDGSSSIENSNGIGVNPVLVEGIIVQHTRLRREGFHTAEISSGAVLEGVREILDMGWELTEYDDKTRAMIGMPSHFMIWKTAARKHKLLVPSSLSTEIELKNSQEGREIRGGMGEAIKHDELLLVGNYHDEADSKEMKIYKRWLRKRLVRRSKVLQTETAENDFHSANVAIAVGAKILMLCTTSKGFMEEGKKRDVIHTEEIDGLVKSCQAGTKNGKGGMATKLQAAKKAAEAGILVIIGSSLEDSRRLIEDNAGTLVVQ